MKMPPFDYVRARDLAHAFTLWDEAGDDAKVVAGGQSLLATLAFRLSSPSTLIDISKVPDLRGITTKGDVLRIGALTTHSELGRDPAVARLAPLLTEAVPLIAHPAIRNRGTIGGSLAFADPAAELPACVVALDATIVAVSRSGERRIPARDFFTGLYETALGPRDLIAAVEIAPSSRIATIREVARRSGDYAMAGLAANVVPGTEGRMGDPRFVFFGVGTGPVVASGAAAVLAGTRGEPEALTRAQAALDDDLDPPEDLHGGPDFKRHLAKVLLARAVARLTSPQAEAA